MEEIIVYFHTDCLLKKNGTNHPERKERLEVVLKTIKKIENIELNGEPEWVKASFVSGLKSLPIRYTLQ